MFYLIIQSQLKMRIPASTRLSWPTFTQLIYGAARQIYWSNGPTHRETPKECNWENLPDRDFSDFGDLSVGLNVNLRGAPTKNKEEFMAFRANPRPIIGASLKVQIPTGHYEADRLVNVGANRWAARLKLGTVMKLKATWLLELSASTWLFGDDNDFVRGKKEQEPIFAAETNIIKRIRPGLWASLDITYYRGGRQTIDGNPLRDKQNNVKLGGTLVVPFLKRHAIKIGYADGSTTRYGNDFTQFIVSYNVVLK